MRKDWTFPYSVSKVLDGAQARFAFHAGRLEFWRAKEAETMERIKSEGLEVKHSLAGSNYSNVARGFGAEIVVDATLQRDLDECANKIREHQEKSNVYRGWVEVLTAQRADVSLQLDHEDYLFFFGKA